MRHRYSAVIRTACIVVATLVVVGISEPSSGGAAVSVGASRTSADSSGSGASLLAPNRPNIVVLVSDDQPMSTFRRDLMPSIYSELVDKGVGFDRFYVSSSVCCPSRSEIFTGLNEQHTGVDSNGTVLARPTIIQALHSLGYTTALAGKYLNSEPCEPPREEFDEWVCQSHDPPSGLSLTDPTLNINGKWTSFKGATTDIEADYAVDFINNAPRDKPFFLLYTPTSPHLPANDPRYGNLPVTPSRPPSFNEDTRTSGKPFYMQRGPMPADEIARHDTRYAKMSRAVRGLDDSMGRILSALGDRESDTLVLFMSDNGFLLGEHRRVAKMVPYEESSHVPFVVRYPRMVPTSSPFRSGALTMNTDLAPTIADILGIHWGADGTSLVPLLTKDATKVRDAGLLNWCRGLHVCAGNKMSTDFVELQLSIPSYFGVVTDQWKYVEYNTGEKELYDLATDPYELTNRASDPAAAAVRTDMAAKLVSLTALPVPDTTIVTGPSGVTSEPTVTFTYFTQSRLGTYQCRLDTPSGQGTWAPCSGQAKSYSGLVDGTYTFWVRGADEAGTVDATPASREFSVGGVPPSSTTTTTTTTTTLPGIDTKAPETTIEVPNQDQSFAGRTISFGGSATDDKSVARVRYGIRNQTTNKWWRPDGTWGSYYLFDAAVAAPGTVSTGWQASWTAPAAGSYGVQATALDAAGNKDASPAWRRFKVTS